MRLWRYHREEPAGTDPASPTVRRPRSDAEALADEAEAFLAGRLAAHLEAAGGDVPGWAAANLLAHAPYDVLEHEALLGRRGLPRDNPAAAAWRLQERMLAWQMISICATPDELRTFQLRVLVPLELELMATPDRVARHDVMPHISQVIDRYLADREDELP